MHGADCFCCRCKLMCQMVSRATTGQTAQSTLASGWPAWQRAGAATSGLQVHSPLVCGCSMPSLQQAAHPNGCAVQLPWQLGRFSCSQLSSVCMQQAGNHPQLGSRLQMCTPELPALQLCAVQVTGTRESGTWGARGGQAPPLPLTAPPSLASGRTASCTARG